MVVGGKGAFPGGGYNGGGSGIKSGSYDCLGGGGATHISTYNFGELRYGDSYKGTYDSNLGTYDGGQIMIVAGGGGGGADGQDGYGSGGSGGGYNGSSTGTGITYSSGTPGYGGTQNSGGGGRTGSFGLGGSSTSSCGSGGGGGWYGGGGSVWRAAGGGSGYIGNSLLMQNKGMYMYSTGCASSSAVATKTTCTSNTGAHISEYANTGNGYAKITYLGTSI